MGENKSLRCPVHDKLIISIIDCDIFATNLKYCEWDYFLGRTVFFGFHMSAKP